jgi:hypothetical protein
MLRVMGSILGLIGVGAACGIMNGVPSKEERDPALGEYDQLDAIRAELDHERVSIEGIEASLRASYNHITASRARIAVLAHEINSLVRAHPAGMPAESFALYRRSRVERDTLIAKTARASDDYSVLYEEYLQRSDRYNQRLTEAIGLAKKAGVRWYVRMIPRLGAPKLAAAGALISG